MTNYIDDIRTDDKGVPLNYYGHAAGPDAISPNDNRQENYRLQRDTRGFDNTELWSLDMTILRFIVPRIEAFADDLYGMPYGMTEQEWKDKLNGFVSDCKILLDFSCKHDKQELARTRFNDFVRDHFFSLWN